MDDRAILGDHPVDEVKVSRDPSQLIENPTGDQ
jgi:hypothetical protein